MIDEYGPHPEDYCHDAFLKYIDSESEQWQTFQERDLKLRTRYCSTQTPQTTGGSTVPLKQVIASLTLAKRQKLIEEKKALHIATEDYNMAI